MKRNHQQQDRISQLFVTLLLTHFLFGCTVTWPTSPNLHQETNDNASSDVNDLNASQGITQGITVTGKIILGYGRHAPVGNLPLWIEPETQDNLPITQTDNEGGFVLTNLSTGTLQIKSTHLDIRTVITAPNVTINLGLIKYPLIHPPNHYYRIAMPLPDISTLLNEGEPIPFSVCFTSFDWERPSELMQERVVWSRYPFNQYTIDLLKAWFEKPAVIYDTVDHFQQGFVNSSELKGLASDWRYLLGLWNDQDLVLHSACDYNATALEDLLLRRQVELWLIGYEATLVQRLAKETIDYNPASLCNASKRHCTQVPGDHWAIHVNPIKGYQVIRFSSMEEILMIHLIKDGLKIGQLPD